jgi:hypothetical protein
VHAPRRHSLQHVLERSAIVVDASGVEARFSVNLPAKGRAVMGRWAATLLAER